MQESTKSKNMPMSDNVSSTICTPSSSAQTIETTSSSTYKSDTNNNKLSEITTDESTKINGQEQAITSGISIKVFKELPISQNASDDDSSSSSSSFTITMDNEFHLEIEDEHDLETLIAEFRRIVMAKNNDQDIDHNNNSIVIEDNEISKQPDSFGEKRVVSKIVTFHSINYLQSFLNLIDSKDINYEFTDKGLDKSLILPGNLYIRGLGKDTTPDRLFEIFSKFGEIESCKVIYDNNGNSKRFGFMNFANKKMAQDAIDNLNDTKIDDNFLFVNHHISKKERLEKLEFDRLFFTTLYISNLPPWFTEDNLFEIFKKFGKIRSIFIPNSEEENGSSDIPHEPSGETTSIGKSSEEHDNTDAVNEKTETTKIHRGYGFVNFRRHTDAVRAMNEMSDFEAVSGLKLIINRAERRQEKYQYQHLNDSFNHSKQSFLKNNNHRKYPVSMLPSPYDFSNIANSHPLHAQAPPSAQSLQYQQSMLPNPLNSSIQTQFQQQTSINMRLTPSHNVQSQQPLPPQTHPHTQNSYFNFQPFYYSSPQPPPQLYSPNDLPLHSLVSPSPHGINIPQFSPNEYRNANINSIPISASSSGEFNSLYQDDNGSISSGSGSMSRNGSSMSVGMNVLSNNNFNNYSDLESIHQVSGLPVAGPKFQDSNLYITGIPLNFKDKDLHDLFSKYGTIVSARIMTSQPNDAPLVEGEGEDTIATRESGEEPNVLEGERLSKGFGFVCFQSPLDTSRALIEMNNFKIPRSKPNVAEATDLGKEESKDQKEGQKLEEGDLDEDVKFDTLHVSFAQRRENRVGKNGDIHHYNQNHSMYYNTSQPYLDLTNRQKSNVRSMSQIQLPSYYSNQQYHHHHHPQQQQQQQQQQHHHHHNGGNNPNYYSYQRRYTIPHPQGQIIGPGPPFYYGGPAPPGYFSNDNNGGGNSQRNINNHNNFYQDPQYSMHPADYKRLPPR